MTTIRLPLLLALLAAAPLARAAAQQPKPAPAGKPAAAPRRPQGAKKVAQDSVAHGKAAPALQVPDLPALVDAWVRLPSTARDRAQKLETLRQWLGPELLRQQFAHVAEDPAQPPLVRATALLAIGDEHPTNLAVFVFALADADPTVRAAAAGALKSVAVDPTVGDHARELLVDALTDPVPAVASRALESLGDRDAGALREYLRGNPPPPPPLATIAGEFLTLAEERGASLVPLDSSGALSRQAAGVKLEYTPTQRWPEDSVSAGTLTARRGEGKPVVLGSAVEVARNVLPAAVSADGRYVAYESGRHIHVRDLESGADRDLGAGVAPRPAPLSPGFVFFAPVKQTLSRDGAALDYKVIYAPFAGGETREVAPVTAAARGGTIGGASPVRWARVTDAENGFILTGDGLSAQVALPDLAGTH